MAEVEFCIRYRKHIAVGIIASILGSFVVGGVLTYTVTDYTAETDLVYRYFDTFNPCIFFDHYPANVVALLGVSFLSIFWAAAGWSCLYIPPLCTFAMMASQNFWSILSPVFGWGLTVICLSFVNIFAVDLLSTMFRL